MTQYVEVVVIAADLAVPVILAIPLVEDLDHLDTTLFQIKTKRSLLAAISGITFDPHPQQPCPRFLIHIRHISLREVQAAVSEIPAPAIQLAL